MRYLSAFYTLLVLIISGCGSDSGSGNPSETVWSQPRLTNINYYVRPATNSRGDYLVASVTESKDVFAQIHSPQFGLIDEYKVGNGSVGVLKLAMNDNGEAVSVLSDWSADIYTLKVLRYSPKSGWSSPQTIRSGFSFSPLTDVAIAPDGSIILVWVETTSDSHSQIYSSRFTYSSGWGQPVQVSSDNYNILSLGGVAVNDKGVAMLIWSQGDYPISGYCFKSVFNPGAGWSPPEAFSDLQAAIRMSNMDQNGNVVLFLNSTTGNFAGRIGITTPFDIKTISAPDYPSPMTPSMNKAGEALITWNYGLDTSGGIRGITYSPLEGWGNEQFIIQGPVYTLFAYYNSGIDGAGNKFVAYGYQENGKVSLRVVRSGIDNVWGAPTTISSTALDIFGPSLTVSPRGTALLLWTAIDSGEPLQQNSYFSFYQ